MADTEVIPVDPPKARKETTAVVPFQFPENLSYEERFAIVAFKSGMFADLASANQALVKIQLGKELGFGPATSLRAVQVIGNAPCLSANTMSALIKRARPRYDYLTVERSPSQARIKFFQEGEEVGEASYSMEEAKAAGITDKKVWKQYPAAMLWARAVSIGFRSFCGDLAFMGNVYDPEEVVGQAQVGEAEVVEIKQAPQQTLVTPAKSQPTEEVIEHG